MERTGLSVSVGITMNKNAPEGIILERNCGATKEGNEMIVIFFLLFSLFFLRRSQRGRDAVDFVRYRYTVYA